MEIYKTNLQEREFIFTTITIVSCLTALVGIILMVFVVKDIIQHAGAVMMLASIPRLFAVLWLILIGISGAFTLLVSTANIVLQENLILIDISSLLKMNVTIRMSSETRIRAVRYVSFEGWRARSLHSYAVYNPNLPWYFFVVGLFYKVGFKPVFIVTPDHANYQELLEKLTSSQPVS